MVKHLIRNKAGSILVVDADANSTLPEYLGIKGAETMAGIVEDVSRRMDKIPAGMTKERFIGMRVQEALSEESGFDLLVMGHPEGPGCYCYVNNLLRDMMAKLTKAYDFVVIDNAAGMEHISRRTTRAIDKLVLVSDYSTIGVRSVKRIHDLARELGIKLGDVFLVVNKARGDIAPLAGEIEKSGLEFAGLIPYDENLHEASVHNKPLFSIESTEAEKSIENIFKSLSKNQRKR